MKKENQVVFVSQELAAAANQIDAVLAECSGLSDGGAAEMVHAIRLAQGVIALRQIFDQEGIRKNVVAMQNTKLGFMTDRSPAAIESAKRKGKTLVPYQWDVIRECCIEAMIQGYRITGNEFNIIASGFYPAKAGKFRKINDRPNVAEFQFSHTPPNYISEQKMDYGKPVTAQYARVQCWASWKQNGQLVKVGDDTGERHDKLVFKVRVNDAMGDDAIVGKSLSKLFTRVLMRVTGSVLLPESTDVEIEDEAAGGMLPETTGAINEEIRGKQGVGKIIDADYEEINKTEGGAATTTTGAGGEADGNEKTPLGTEYPDTLSEVWQDFRGSFIRNRGKGMKEFFALAVNVRHIHMAPKELYDEAESNFVRLTGLEWPVPEQGGTDTTTTDIGAGSGMDLDANSQPGSPIDYTTLTPGSDVWIELWEKYPEHHEEMLLFRSSDKGKARAAAAAALNGSDNGSVLPKCLAAIRPELLASDDGRELKKCHEMFPDITEKALKDNHPETLAAIRIIIGKVDRLIDQENLDEGNRQGIGGGSG